MDRSKITKRVWQCLTAAVFIYTAVVIVRNLITIVRVNYRISEMEDHRDLYQARITEESTMLEHLKYDEYLEQYAREKFHMQRPNEYIYIIEE